ISNAPGSSCRMRSRMAFAFSATSGVYFAMKPASCFCGEGFCNRGGGFGEGVFFLTMRLPSECPRTAVRGLSLPLTKSHHPHVTHAAHAAHSSHATHATHAAAMVVVVVVFLLLFGDIRDQRFGGEQQAGNTRSILKSATRYLHRIDHAGLAQVGVLVLVG